MLNPQFALIPVVTVEDGRSTLPSMPGTSTGAASVPAAQAADYWVRQGAQRIQIVNGPSADGHANLAAIKAMVRGLRHQARTDLVAGVHDDATLAAALDIASSHVVLSAAAMADLDFVARASAAHADKVILRVVVGDGGAIHAPGSAADGLDIWSLLPQLDAIKVPSYLVSDATRHGHWWSSHKGVLEQFVASTPRHVTAGSGVDTLENLHELSELVAQGLDGAVIGHALNVGAFTLADAQTAVEARYDPYEWGPAQP